MMARLHEKRNREGGFTLIELLIVIVILGILAAVVVVSVRGITDRGTSAACGATLTSVITANEAHRAQTGNYPTQTVDLVPNFLTLGSGATIAGNVVAGSGWTFTFAPATSTVTAGGCP